VAESISGGILVEGGYILISRRLFKNEIMDKPHLYLKLWIWMLFKANFKDHEKLQRGQLLTSIDEMREAMSYLVGYRKMRPTRDEIRSAYETFVKASMISTLKTTRGMIITILNYNKYQNIKNYEAHIEDLEGDLPKPTITPHYKGKKEGKNVKTPTEISNEISVLTDKLFSTDQGKELFSRTIAGISLTRKTKKLSPSVLFKILQDLSKYPEDRIIHGMKIYLQKGCSAQGKKENYLVGIIRNQKTESDQSEKSSGSFTLDEYYRRKQSDESSTQKKVVQKSQDYDDHNESFNETPNEILCN